MVVGSGLSDKVMNKPFKVEDDPTIAVVPLDDVQAGCLRCRYKLAHGQKLPVAQSETWIQFLSNLHKTKHLPFASV